jgi:hypothetical protein
MEIELITLEDTQKPAINQIIDSLKDEKTKAIKCGDEAKANACWRELEGLELNLLYIQAFHNIKTEKYREAWIQLEQCEIKYKFLSENSTEDYLCDSRAVFIENYVSKWQSLYPYCVFASPGFKVGYYTCSICNHKIRPRSRCEHKKGKVYNGELCLHIGHELEFLEISIVSTPVQKYSVMHNDETLDFTLLKYLSDILENAFEEWNVNWTTMKFPAERFISVKTGDKCPCKSGNNFEACCMGQDEIEIPHVDFIFSKQLPNDKQAIIFPY